MFATDIFTSLRVRLLFATDIFIFVLLNIIFIGIVDITRNDVFILHTGTRKRTLHPWMSPSKFCSKTVSTEQTLPTGVMNMQVVCFKSKEGLKVCVRVRVCVCLRKHVVWKCDLFTLVDTGACMYVTTQFSITLLGTCKKPVYQKI